MILSPIVCTFCEEIVKPVGRHPFKPERVGFFSLPWEADTYIMSSEQMRFIKRIYKSGKLATFKYEIAHDFVRLRAFDNAG